MKQLQKHMKTTATVATPTGEDDYGTPTFSSTRTIKCRREQETVALKSDNGITFTTKDMLLSFDEVLKEDLIWFPGADTSSIGEAYRAKTVSSSASLSDGTVIYEVTLG